MEDEIVEFGAIEGDKVGESEGERRGLDEDETAADTEAEAEADTGTEIAEVKTFPLSAIAAGLIDSGRAVNGG